MRKLMTAVAAAMLVSSVGVASVGAYARNSAPNLIGSANCNLSVPAVTFAWDKNAGKPAAYSYVYPYSGGTWSGSGKVPGGAGARGFLSVTLDATNSPTPGGTITVTVTNASGSDSIDAVCNFVG